MKPDRGRSPFLNRKHPVAEQGGTLVERRNGPLCDPTGRAAITGRPHANAKAKLVLVVVVVLSVVVVVAIHLLWLRLLL